ncbi:peroxiredoxin [Devosia sp. SD17-2]|jgi:peroxiredoxin|uniref:peroxiredoxin family protein n=1 Tax=Devosia sp. SD17-2 TaxID=2976459 RepID=UPI0023D88E5D|nr:peroxiredoxin [Devosia sp. SD17-2]WEJ32518.1 peroxiredoxin [Devosia sp. SD17-2]
MIERGNAIPSVGIKLVTASGTTETTSLEAFGTGVVVLFSVPGAFTPTCHVNHLPGFLANAGKLKAAGVDKIVCASVNDQHVMKAWAEASEALDSIDFLADGNAELAEALGLARDFAPYGMGTRYARAALILRDGVVSDIFVEDGPGVNASGAPAILMALEAANA